MIIVCGGLRIDFVISADGQARLNQPGGNAVYAAVGARLAPFDDEVKILARAGENYPQAWLEDLSRRGIGSDLVRRVAGWQDMRTFYAYVDEKTRDDRNPEKHFARIGQPLPSELEGYTHSTQDTQNEDSPLALRAEDALKAVQGTTAPANVGATAVHLAPGALRSQHELVREFRRRGGRRADGGRQITVDPGEYDAGGDNAGRLEELCSRVDAFLPSEMEVKLLLESDDLHAAALTFAGWGTSVVVIKCGPDGCLLYEKDLDRFTTIPAYPAQVLDVTGAGDVFSGAFAATLGHGEKPLHAALVGSAAASFAVEGYGALYALDAAHRGQFQERLQWLRERVDSIASN